MMEHTKFAILITTKNRRDELDFTLSRISHLIARQDVKCIVVDDGSSDGTNQMLSQKYPSTIVLRNEISKGLMVNRNWMLNSCNADFAISLDDDLHFITEDPLEDIENYFDKNPEVAVLGFRIFWHKSEPNTTITEDIPIRVQSFAGGANVWRTKHWQLIPDYPEWFEFYGEEDFASYHLFKKHLEVHYFPDVLTNHRIDLKSRKNDKDYVLRLRRSLRSGWYLYHLFLPKRVVSRKMGASIKSQLLRKVFKGDLGALKAMIFAGTDFLKRKSTIKKHRNKLTIDEYLRFQKLPSAKIYWKEEN